MEVLKGAETSAQVTHNHLRLLLGLPPPPYFPAAPPPPYFPPAPPAPPASERPPVVSELPCGRWLLRVSPSSFNWLLTSLFISALGLVVIRLVLELLVTGAHQCCGGGLAFGVQRSSSVLLAFLPLLMVTAALVQRLMRRDPTKSISGLVHHV